MWVYEEGSFSKAAQKARVAQPVLSMQIRRLEDHFGVQLFERHARGIKPTEFGEKLYSRSVAIMRNVTLAEDDLRQAEQVDTLTGRIHVGLSGMFNRNLLRRILLPFMERYPQVDVTISESYTGTLMEWVRDGLIDFAVGSRPAVEGNLVQRLLYKDRVVLLSGSPLFGPSLSPCDLTQSKGLKLILPTTKHSFGKLIKEYIESGIIQVEKVIEINSTVGAVGIAMSSDWAVVASVIAVLDDLENPKSFIYPVIEPAIPFDLYTIYDRRRPLSAAARQFIQMIEVELGKVEDTWKQTSRDPTLVRM